MKRTIPEIFLFCFLLFFSLKLRSQNHTIDSLQKVLQTQEKKDSNTVHTLIALSLEFHLLSDYVNQLKHAQNAKNLSEKLNFDRGLGMAYNYIGTANYYLGNYAESESNFLMGVSIFEKLGDKKNMAVSLQFLSGSYYDMGNDSLAYEAMLTAIKINDASGFESSKAQNYNSIASYYIKDGRFDNALQKIYAALEIYKKGGLKSSSWGLPWCYQLLGKVYSRQGEIEKAKGNGDASVAKFDTALKNYLVALALAEKTDNKSTVVTSCLLIGYLKLIMNDPLDARKYYAKSLALSELINYKTGMMDSYFGLARSDSMQGNYHKAYQQYEIYVSLKDSLWNQDVVRKSESYRLQSDFDKKKDQIKLLSTENELNTALAAKESQRKNFAYLGIAAIILAGGYGFYRYRRRKRLQNRQALSNERLRISRELHDEVGATLSGIAMYSHLAKEQIKNINAPDAERSLNIMQQSSGEMVNKLNDIVWLINPEQDSLEKLIERLEEYAANMAAIKKMQVKIDVPEKIASISLSIESRRSIYLFCKEAINNAVKYSNGSLLELKINQVNNKLEFAVSDNGKGFDAVMVKRGNGLENMQQRADEIGAKLLLQSRMNEGARISMQIDITH